MSYERYPVILDSDRETLPIAPFEASYEAQRENFHTYGRQFVPELEGYKARSPLPVSIDGEPAEVDVFMATQGVGTLFMGDNPEVAARLHAFRVSSSPAKQTFIHEDYASALRQYLEFQFIKRRLILGVSGYGTDQINGVPISYKTEMEGLESTLNDCRDTHLFPALMVDGATNIAIPGISGCMGYFSQELYGEKISTLGCTTVQGLHSLGPRDALIVRGVRYGRETFMVGTIPDVLIMLGGGPHAAQEYEAAVQAGNRVIILRLKHYKSDCFSNTFINHELTADAMAKGQVMLCEDTAALKTAIATITPEVFENMYTNRNSKIDKLLGSPDEHVTRSE